MQERWEQVSVIPFWEGGTSVNKTHHPAPARNLEFSSQSVTAESNLIFPEPTCSPSIGPSEVRIVEQSFEDE
jgi:hypothetical protein